MRVLLAFVVSTTVAVVRACHRIAVVVVQRHRFRHLGIAAAGTKVEDAGELREVRFRAHEEDWVCRETGAEDGDGRLDL